MEKSIKSESEKDASELEKDKEDNLWKGFKFPMGFFLVWKDGKCCAGKCDPITKEVIHWYEVD